MNEDFYISLIYKKLSEEISPPETEQLNTWMNESKENQETAAAVELAWSASENLQADVEVDLDEEFDALEDLMKEDKKADRIQILEKQIKPQLGITRRLLSIAAGLLFLLTAALLLRMNLNSEQPIEWKTITTGEENYTATLPDNSKVILNKNSQLTYPDHFNSDQRLVKLVGEGFFDVAHDAAHPFIVETEQEKVTVLGTSFNVLTTDKGLTSVYVETGKVQVEQKESAQKIILVKGEKGTSNIHTKEVKNRGPQSANDLAWYTHVLEFKNTSMDEVFNQISKLYGVEFEIENKAMNLCTFTAKIENEKIEMVLKIIEATFDIEIQKTSTNNYLVKGEGCE